MNARLYASAVSGVFGFFFFVLRLMEAADGATLDAMSPDGDEQNSRRVESHVEFLLPLWETGEGGRMG
ncbi:unnamed protein product [Lampetra planeri]